MALKELSTSRYIVGKFFDFAIASSQLDNNQLLLFVFRWKELKIERFTSIVVVHCCEVAIEKNCDDDVGHDNPANEKEGYEKN